MRNVNRFSIVMMLIVVGGCSTQDPKDRFREIAKESSVKMSELFPHKEWKTTVEFIEDENNVPVLQGIIIHTTILQRHFTLPKHLSREDVPNTRESAIKVFFHYDDDGWSYKRNETGSTVFNKSRKQPKTAAEIFDHFDEFEYHERLGIDRQEYRDKIESLEVFWKQLE